MGIEYGRLGEHNKALDCFKKAVEVDPKDEIAWFGMGLVYDELGDHIQEIECYKRALEINPNFELARKELEAKKK